MCIKIFYIFAHNYVLNEKENNFPADVADF